jgi:hemophore-related protein
LFDAANQFTGNALANGWLQAFLGAPPEQRQQFYSQAQARPEFQQNRTLINQVARTCNNF